MRTCKQCDSEMVNGFDIKVDGASYSTIFSERIEKPKVAICPKCGEVSLYIEKLDKISSR